MVKKKRKIGARVQEETWKRRKVFVARNKKGQLISWSSIKKFKTIKNFKRFIQDKGFFFGQEIYKKRATEVKLGKDFAQIESVRFIRPRRANVKSFRVIAEYDGLMATSGFFRGFFKGNAEDAREQALFNLSLRIINRRRGITVTDPDQVQLYEDDILIEMHKIRENAKYTYIYVTEPFSVTRGFKKRQEQERRERIKALIG